MSLVQQGAPARSTFAPRKNRKWGRLVGRYVILIAVLLFAVFPFLWTLVIAITDKHGGGSIYNFPASLFPKAVTFRNFVEVYNQFSLGKYVWNSVSITALTVIGTLLVSALAAYPLARFKFPGRDLIFGIIIATLVLPGETTFIVNILTLSKLGLLGTHLGVALPTIAGAFGIFLMRQAFLGIPQALIEAARIDGAKELTILTRIMLPLTKPSLAALGIFTLVAAWNAYFWPMLVLSSAPDKAPLSVAVLRLKGQFNYDPFNIAAGSLIMMVPVLLVFLAAQKLFMRGMEGAVK